MIRKRFFFHMPGVDCHRRQTAYLQNVIQRFPVRTRAFHCDHLTPAGFRPVSQFQQFSSGRARLTNLFLPAIAQAGYRQFFVNVNSATNVVNLILFYVRLPEKLQHGSPPSLVYYTSFCRFRVSTGRPQ